jgi:FkbM family methyltransferase
MRRALLLESRKISLVLDVGASEGSYASQLRRLGYQRRIVSFEPLSEAFAALESAASEDSLWDVHNLALGSSDASARINIAGNSTSSSLLGMHQRHLESAPQANYVGTEQVKVARLDSIWPWLVSDDDKTYLKLDVQGFELEALKGAGVRLETIECVQAELSFVRLYEDAPTYLEVIDYLGSRGFRLAGLEDGHDDRQTGEMLQADGIFVRDR